MRRTVTTEHSSAIATQDASPSIERRKANRRDASESASASFETSRAGTKPRILILNRSYWPDAEATGQLLTELCEDLAKEFDITVVAGQPNQNPAGIPYKSWGAERHQGVTIRRVPHLKLGKRSIVGRGLSMLTYFVGAAVTALFAPRADVVIVETDPFLLPLLGRCLQWRHRCRLVVYLQDIYPDVAIAVGKVRDGWFTRLLRRSLFAVYRHADRVIVLGEDMRALLTSSGIPNDRITSLPNWVDTTRIFPIPLRNLFRQRERLDDKFVVMYSGNMGLCQNLDEILQTAELLQGREIIEFVLIGGGASRARLEETTRNKDLKNVRFLPYQPLADLAHSLSAANLHLVPLDPRVTGCLVPSKLYGILAAGVPTLVIADERSEASRVVRESATGRVVAPGHPEQLAEAICWFVDHERERKAMGRRARDLAEREYDRRRTTGRFAALLEGILERDQAGIESRGDAWVSVGNELAVHVRQEPVVATSPKVSKPTASRGRFLKGKRIVVTGGTGFLGRFVFRALERFEPAEVLVPRSTQYDLRDRDAVRTLIRDANPDVVVHLAATVDGAGARPGRHFYDNAIIGLQLMEEARLARVEKFVCVGTSCSYPKRIDVPLREQQMWDGDPEETDAPYGLATKMLAVQAQAYREQYGLNAITLALSSIYGPRDNFDLASCDVIPALIRQVVEARDSVSEHLDLERTATASRDFLFVRDAAKAIALATQSYDNPEPVSIGSGQEVTIRELAEMVCDLAGFKGEIRWDRSKPVGKSRRWLDTAQAELEFGFKASTRLRDALIETLAWYERHRERIENESGSVSKKTTQPVR